MKEPEFTNKVVQIPFYPVSLDIVIGYDSDKINEYVKKNYFREDFYEILENSSGVTFAEPGRIIVVFNLKSKPKEKHIVHESAHVVVKLIQMIKESVKPNHFFIYHQEFIADSILSFFKKHKLIETKYNY